MYDGCDNAAGRRNLTIESVPGKRGNIKVLEYDLWCACWDGNGSNTGIGRELAAFDEQAKIVLPGSHLNTTGGGGTTTTSTTTISTSTTTTAAGQQEVPVVTKEVRVPASIPMTLTPAQQTAFLGSAAVMLGVKTAAETFYFASVGGTGSRRTEVLNPSFAKTAGRVLLASSLHSRELQQAPEAVIFTATVKITLVGSSAAAAGAATQAIETQATAADQTSFQTALITKIAEQVASAAVGDPILALPGGQEFTSATLGQIISVPTPAASVEVVATSSGTSTTVDPATSAASDVQLKLMPFVLLTGWTILMV